MIVGIFIIVLAENHIEACDDDLALDKPVVKFNELNPEIRFSSIDEFEIEHLGDGDENDADHDLAWEVVDDDSEENFKEHLDEFEVVGLLLVVLVEDAELVGDFEVVKFIAVLA